MNITVENIKFRYDPDIPLLEEIDFSISESAFAFIIGLNGSGKSTLLKTMARLLKPANGAIKLDGKNIERYTAKALAKVLAFVPQNQDFAFPYSVYDFIATGRTPYLNFYGVLRNRDKEIIERNMRLLDIEKLSDKSVTEISGGEFRRAAIARALSQEPEILLLDEPSAFLDIEHQISIFEFLQSLNADEGLTVITVSHDLNLTGMFADEVVLLENGKATKFDKREILTREKIKKHFRVNSVVTATGENINVTITRAQ